MNPWNWIRFGKFVEAKVEKKTAAKCCVCRKGFQIGDDSIELIYCDRLRARLCSEECKKKFIDDKAHTQARMKNIGQHASETRFLKENRESQRDYYDPEDDGDYRGSFRDENF